MTRAFGEYDAIKLKRAVYHRGYTFPSGAVGTIVHEYPVSPSAYIVEMVGVQGQTLELIDLLLDVEEDDIELFRKDDLRE